MKNFDKTNVRDILTDVDNTINSAISDTNSAATRMYNSIKNYSEEVEGYRKKISVMGDMITDLNVITGNTKTSVQLSDLPVVSSKGITYKDSGFTLDTLREATIEYDAATSLILSEKPYIIKDMSGRTKTLSDVFKYDTPTTLEVTQLGYSFKFVLKYSKISKINRLVLTLPQELEDYPFIDSITAVSKNNVSTIPVRILNHNSYNYSLDDNRVVGNRYEIDIESISTKEIEITFTSKISTKFELVSLKTEYHIYETNGEIVLGPVVSDEPILKIGLSSVNTSDNVTLSVSTDNNEWILLKDVNTIEEGNNRKVVSFNTINSRSFKTESKVLSLYIKLSLKASTIESVVTNEAYEDYREDGLIDPSVLSSVENGRYSAYRVKTSDFTYGRNAYSSTTEIDESTREDMSRLFIAGYQKVLGFSSSIYALGKDSLVNNNIDIELKPKRLEAKVDIDTNTFDSVGGDLYDIMVVDIRESINTLASNNLCFKLKHKEDTYKLVSKVSKDYITFKVDSNYITNSTQTLFEVPYDDILLKDSLGETLVTFAKEGLFSVEDKGSDGETVKHYFVNLIDILYEKFYIKDYKYNPMYPIKALESNEYAMLDGRLVLGKGSIVNVVGFKTIKSKINKSVNISYQNGNSWKRIDPLYTYNHTQIDLRDQEVSVIKLDHTSIEPGSLAVYEYADYKNTAEAITLITVEKTINKVVYLTEEYDSGVYIKE